MQRHFPIRRSSSMRRHARVRARNADRRASEFARCYLSDERVAFVRSLPCVTCGRTPSDNAHVGPNGAGAGRKANYDQIVNLCRVCHRELHQTGRVVQKWGTNIGVVISRPALQLCAAILQATWLTYSGGDL